MNSINDLENRLDAMDLENEKYLKSLRKRPHKSYTFKVCPICGSFDVGKVDTRPLGSKNASICRKCGYIK